ncbi:hypothetical protein ARMSODRAFT_1017842 [Armillaria solidipes]|uniref:Uncharacterized protein n=1 Tax=Armillaria solidipes TaxID=1076256 RepID=A0A2H3BHD4_9AGAR|nr:hypothetical protein ARMSODRAFT_1017842 [Armillaria solidipes]
MPLNSDQIDMDIDVEDPAAEVAWLKVELAETYEQIKATKAAAAAAAVQQEPVESIHELKKPKGEAEDKKRGFVLRDTMRLEDDAVMYKEILVRVKTNAIKAGIDFKHEYKNQNKETLGKVFKASWTTMPNDTEHKKELAAYLM